MLHCIDVEGLRQEEPHDPPLVLAGGGLQYLVEEALAELVHRALQLAALALPLLVVAHRLGRGPLPRGGSGVVVHIVEPAPLIHSLLPAGRETGKEGEDFHNSDFQAWVAARKSSLEYALQLKKVK